MQKRKKILVILSFLIVFLVIPVFDNNQNIFINTGMLKTSTDNYLFNGVEYDIELNDVYDDANLTKIYTGANFQTVFLENESITFNEAVSPVNNTNYKSPYNTDVSMIDGTFDNTDNMRANDDYYTDFTSTDGVFIPNEYIDSITYDMGIYKDGNLANTQVDDTTFYRGEHYGLDNYIRMNLFFDPVVGGRDFYLSMWARDLRSVGMYLKINGIIEESEPETIDFDNQLYTGVNSIELETGLYTITVDYLYIYYFKLVEDLVSSPAELDYTVDLDFNEVDTSKLLALDVSSFHYTNISTDIIGNIYDYDSGTYTEMFSSSNTVETENYFSDESSVSDYLDGSGNLKLQFRGTNINNDFKMFVDYIKVRFYYKMDLIHTISFETNGLWKYRWEIFGSLQYTDWTFFEVVDPEPNFHAISESGITTRWILQEASLTSIEDFHDDINTDYWNLIDVSNIDFDYQVITTADAYVINHEGSDVNYGSEQYLRTEWTGTPSEYIFRSHLYFPDLEPNYLFTNQSGLDKIGVYLFYVDYAGDVYCSDTTSFTEGTITFNNAPSGITLQDTTYMSGSGYKYWEISDLTGYYVLYTDEIGARKHSLYASKEYGSYEPTFIRYDINKNYFGSGYMYMQTDTTESIALQSQDYGSHYTLSSGDYFEVDFQTSSDSLINLILLKDGVEQKTLMLSQSGNTDFNRHTVQISVSESLEFDQLKISSTFEDGDNMKVYDIKTYKYTLTGDYEDFYVSPINQRDVYLVPETYNLRIFEEGIKKVDVDITISSTDYWYVYAPTGFFQSRITLWTPNNEYLNIEEFHINISRILDGVRSDFWLLDNLFYVDEDTNVYLDVYDRFDNLIESFEKVANPFIDLTLDVYTLKIKNEATEMVDYTLTNIITTTEKTGLLFPDEIEYFHLTTGSYSLVYINYEDMFERTYNFELLDHLNIAINTTYYRVYIGLFTYDGLGIDHDLVRFYVDGSRRDFGFNSFQSETANLVVLDYFNNTLANETIGIHAYDDSEYNLFVEIYTLNLLNRFTYEDMIINITQVNSGMYMNQLIPASSSLLYRFIPNLNYTIIMTYLNDTIYSIRTINLTSNNQIESFGLPTTGEEYPKNVYFGVYTSTGLGIDFDLLKLYIDGTRTNFGFNHIEDMIITIVVRDYFNTTLFNQLINTSGIYEYNILVELYSTKFFNDGSEVMNYTLTLSGSTIEDSILPSEIIQYNLAPNTYIFAYTNQEDGSYHTFSIVLDANKYYILNTTYYNIYFSLYDLNIHIFDSNQYEFRLNGTIEDFGMIIELRTDFYNITVMDRFGVYLFNDIINLRGLNEYRIDIYLYEIQIRHLANENSNITIAELTTGIDFSFLMAPDTIYSLLIASSNYNIVWINGENNESVIYSISLTSDYILTLETTYYNIYFTLFDVNLHLFDSYQYEFRLNGTIKDLGMVVNLRTDYYNISIQDRFGISLFNDIIYLRDLNEYRIDISLYELQIRHLARENGNLTLSETTGHSSLDFNMAPDSLTSFILGSSTYNITWLNNENGITTTYDINLITDYILTLNTSYYNIYFSLFDLNLHIIDSGQYVFRLNGTLHDFGLIADLQTDDYTITVIDRFGTSLFNNIITLRGLNEYRIDITLYEIQIRHLANENSNITIKETTLNNSLSFIMAPDTIFSILMASSNYNITWINGENGENATYFINLNQDYVLTLETSYFNVYFSIYNYDGLGLDETLFKFYINNERSPLGFNTLNQNENNLTVLDFFSSILYNVNVNLSGYLEFDIQITVFTVFIINNFNRSIQVEVSRGSNNFTFILGSRTGFQLKMLPSVDYTISAYELDDEIIESKNITLDEEYLVVDFGFYEAELPVVPDFYVDDMWLQIILIIIIFAVIIAFIIWIAVRLSKRNKTSKRKLYRQITKERDVEAEFYGGKQTPF